MFNLYSANAQSVIQKRMHNDAFATLCAISSNMNQLYEQFFQTTYLYFFQNQEFDLNS